MGRGCCRISAYSTIVSLKRLPIGRQMCAAPSVTCSSKKSVTACLTRPHAETPPQGINTSDTLQCQADQFLHAVLHKKEFPESCDPIIPLAAQELMRKMIRQFAVEYAHKIQTTESQNAITQTEPDGPLDLTLSRNTQCAQQDGVLDLSKKNTPSLNTLTQQRLSGCEEREEGQERRVTALEEVMTSLCAHHKVLLLHILQEMATFLQNDDHDAQRDVSGTTGTRGGRCCRTDESLCVSSSRVAFGCVRPCRLDMCALQSMCLCVNSCGGYSCPGVTLGCASCCARPRILVCPHHTQSKDIRHVAQTYSCHSPSPPTPSPPPLSPKPQDAESSQDMPTLNTYSLNTQPPPLLLHNTHTDQTAETHTKPEHLIDLMDKFTDTLMEASEREWSVHTDKGDSVKVCDDAQVTEIITTVLHSSSEKDYNLKELFEQHLASEKRSPQTRLQRRQEVRQAISRPHDQPATRRQSLQIKRDLARLEPYISRKKRRKTHMITKISHTQNPDTSTSHNQSRDRSISHTQNPDTSISHTQSRDTSISHTQNPDTPILHTQSPDPPISHTQSPDTPISHTQNPDTPISHTQNPDTPISHTQNPDTPILNVQSVDTPISHTQNPDMPISHTQNPDRPISHTQSPDTPISHTQSPDTPISHTESPDTPISHTQSSDMSISHTQTPTTHILHIYSPDPSISHTQGPDPSISHTQGPDPSISHTQGPDKSISHTQGPDTPISHTQSSDTPISHTQSPDTPISHTQSPDTPISHTHSPDTPISHTQRPDTPISHTQHPDTPISHTQCPDTPNSNDQNPDRPNLYPQRPDTGNVHSNSSEICTEKSEPCPLRSRRNIVRPQHLSSYVTEPRKMFYSACRSAKTNSTPTHGTNTTDLPPSAVIEQPKSPHIPTVKRKLCQDEDGEQPHTEHVLKDKAWITSPVPEDSTDTDDLKYVSPIKLMLVSTVKDEDGVKYMLRAAQPHHDEELFDPCKEALWARSTIKEWKEEETVQTVNKECTENLSAVESASAECSRDCMNETESSFKRRPGRPKKLKAPTEKTVKRPIGRPRKSKPVDTAAVPSEGVEKQGTEEVSSKEHSNKNLKITIKYGRRKARRMVCEGQVPSESNGAFMQSEENAQSTQAQVCMTKDQFSLVMPVEDKKSLTHSVVCPKQSDGAVTRRPGRPAKVKISGISVTVTTVSPRRRKIHMKRDARDPATQGRQEQHEEQETITEVTKASVRHSARERKPSVHLLQCVAMSRPTQSPRSCKLLPNKVPQAQQHDSKDGNDAESSGSPQNDVHFSSASIEPLFDANLRWWPTSASPEMLKEEMNRRMKVMKDTWVSDASDPTVSDEENSSASSSSAVRMLFERDCSMGTLCSWFMQTTETQSLAIVKKANNRIPSEVFQYSSGLTRYRPNACSNPQTERLRKCIKKFATVVPKSPMKLKQERLKLHSTQNCFPTRNNDAEKSQQFGSWRLYRTALGRAKSRFKSRTKSVEYKSLNEQDESRIQPKSASRHDLPNAEQRESPGPNASQKQITANAWIAHTLRECKVFLRKLNSANTCSLSKESGDCTVRFSVSPAGGGSVPHRKQRLRKKVQTKTTCTWQQCKANRKRKLSCTNTLHLSPKRQRSSRGVMAAKWSDFILGPAR
ncbi:hypothetical protein HF521_015347 [Silurus meridionalis]|uniref:Uncharacterized protein n=1 Tax=Silurus meridionalis TaxID=175797 RepID=A0A8T0A7N1_SILME|nr:hypothetical protein HF521_015347 [Silurus meridionalis]